MPGAEIKARITVDAQKALQGIEDLNKASGFASQSMSKMAKELGQANAALESLEGSAGIKQFKAITDELKKNHLAYKVLYGDQIAAAKSAKDFERATLAVVRSGSATKDQIDYLSRGYHAFSNAALAAKKSSDSFNSSVGNSGLKLLSVAKNILKSQLLMGPVTAAVRGFKNTISDSMNVAAEAEQRFSKLATVFDGISEAARGAATSIASSLGVANSTAASALSTVGDLLQAQGMGTSESLSTASEWVRKFQDIIAFKDINMSLEEFAQNFMSGAAGNLRNFRTFGSIVKESAVNARLAAEGYDKLTGSELELAKMTTRATMALEQQENAIGATQREWETMLSVNRRLSEAWKEYKENLGDSLNKFIKPAKTWLAEILDYTNDVTRALKEIEGGEFTVKVQQESSEDFLRLVGDTLLSYVSGTNTAGFFGKANEAIALASGATMSQIYPTGSLTAQQIADVMRATGATSAQIREAIAGTNQLTVSDEVLADAQVIVNRLNAVQQAAESAAQTIIASGEAYDSFTESLATLPGINVRSTNLAAIGAGVNEYNYEDLLESFGLTATGQVSKIMEDVLSQMGGLGTDAFIDNIDKAFGLGDKEQAYTSWLNEIKDLYTILYNRQKKFGDISDKTLQSVINMWGEVNGKLHDYLAGIERTKIFDTGIANMQGNAASYNRQYQLVGLEGLALQKKELELTFNELKASLKEITDDEMKKLDTAYENQIAALTRLYEAQEKYAARLEAESTGRTMLSGYQGDIEKAGFIASHAGKKAIIGGQAMMINETQAGIWYDLQKASADMSAKLPQLSYTINQAGQKVYDFGNGMAMTAVEINKALNDYFIPKILDAADAAENFWKAIGDRALGSTGTLGGVIQSFQGDGDIWTKIVNALLTILENTESWGEIAEMLDQIFAMFEPVTEALIDLIVSLPWEDIIFMLKVIASAITIISGVVQGIQTVIKWLWDNIKTALRNVATDVYNLFHPLNTRSRDQYRSFEELVGQLNKIADDTNTYLDRIWSANEKIERNTSKGDDYAKQLALLKSLYDNRVLTDVQYSGEVAKVTGSSLGTVERYSGTTYATGSGGVTYYTGDRTYNISLPNFNGDARELWLELQRIDAQESRGGGNLFS